MKINEQWLREWVDPAVNTDQLAEQLTMAGMEVEGIEYIDVDFSGVVIACVESIEAHPNADKLKVCKVNCGDPDVLTIVCGADNVHAGMYVPLAKIGAKLPGNKLITETELKGILSQGMLCSTAELGLSDEADGLLGLSEDLTPGQDFVELLAAEDSVLDISLTPNRGDCLSIRGVAREVAVLNQCILNAPAQEAVTGNTDTKRAVELNAPIACSHYIGRVIENVDISNPAPIWLTEKLRRCGLRSINPIVDVTNYVMLELGQPMHAFDNDKLEGSISVRYATEGEKLVLLDQQEVILSKDTLVIADEQQVLAMAGIMGGLDTAVTTTSQNIFLESAFFSPKAILGQARRYGLHTDSSHRFERGVDYELQLHATERATQLILDICGGAPGPNIEAVAEQEIPRNSAITLRHSHVNRVLGIDIDAEKIIVILQGLGMSVVPGQESWQVTAPSYRFDIKIEADLIEEIARIYGYNNIPEQLPVTTLCFQAVQREQEQLKNMRQCLVYRGYQEAITYSFVDEKLQNYITPDKQGIRLANPIATDMAMMRTSLWPGLLQALLYNANRQQTRIRLFETGLVFNQEEEEIKQELMLAGLIYGNLYYKQWASKDLASDIFDIKGDLEAILAACGYKNAVKYRSFSHPALHPGQSSEIIFENQRVGCFGVLHPEVQMQLELVQAAYLFELEVGEFSKQLTPKYQKLSKFPAIRRDLAIVVDTDLPVDNVVDCIGNAAPDVLHNLELFDVYQGEGIDLGKKSLALGLTFQGSSSTLTDEGVEAMVGEILQVLRVEFGATLRE